MTSLTALLLTALLLTALLLTALPLTGPLLTSLPDPYVPEEVLPDGVSALDVGRGGVVLVVTVVLAIVVRIALVRVIDRGDADRHTGRLVGRFLSVLVVVVGVVYAVDLVGVRVGPLLGALGIGGIALAFAAQDILQNFVAGLLLQVRRPFRLGEQVRSGDFEGAVQDINLRTVVLTTYDGTTVYLPNSQVLSAPIINYTRTPLNRSEITVGLAYDTDLERARDVLLGACRTAEHVVERPGPEAWVDEFGESSIDVVLRYWHLADIASRWRARNAVALAVKRELDRAGMTIPFPQRTLWFGPGETSLQVRQQTRDAGEG